MQEISHSNFFQPLLNLSENWSLVTFMTKLGRIQEIIFMLSCPQGQTIDVKCKKLQQICGFDFFSAIIEHGRELVTRTFAFIQIWEEYMKVMTPTWSNY